MDKDKKEGNIKHIIELRDESNKTSVAPAISISTSFFSRFPEYLMPCKVSEPPRNVPRRIPVLDQWTKADMGDWEFCPSGLGCREGAKEC